METRDYVCADCKVNVFEFASADTARTSPYCASCEMIRNMKAEGKLSAKNEADLREILDCMIPEDDDALRTTDQSPG